MVTYAGLELRREVGAGKKLRELSAQGEWLTPEYWSGLPCPSPEDLPDPRTNPGLLLQTDSLLSEPQPGRLWKNILQPLLILHVEKMKEIKLY